MQGYLQPDLSTAGVDGSTPGPPPSLQTVDAFEMAPEGGALPAVHPLRPIPQRPGHAPDLARRRRRQHRRDLHLPTPTLARGQPRQRMPEPSSSASDTLMTYVEELGRRAEKVRNRAVRPEEDNMLKLSGDGRKAALDLASSASPPTRPRQDRRGRRPDRRHLGTAPRRRLPDDGDQAAPGRGSLQLVFCDLGTPKRGLDRLQRAARPARRPRRPRARRGSSTKPERTRPKPTCSPPAATGTSPCSSDPPRRWASAPTSRPAPSPCTTSTARGGPPISNSAKAASSARATRTRGPDHPLRHRAASTSTCGRPSNAKHGSSPRSSAAARRPRDRRHRRPGPLLRRSQSPRHRQPADHGQS